jgi:amino acid transporter
MIYCIIHKISYSSSLNLFAIAAGILLIRGSLRTASYVRWLSVFFVSGIGAALLAWPAIQPLDLTLTELRLNTAPAVVGVCATLLVAAVSYWVGRQLGDEQIRKATQAARVTPRDVRWAAATGICLVICLTIVMHFILGGETAQRMMSIAEKEVGPGYELHVKSVRFSQHGGEKSVAGVVTAWNDREVRQIPVHWEEGSNP